MTSFADGQDEDVGAERTLALAYAPASARDALAALWQLDARMRRLYLSRREPIAAAIRLAWWRERLMELLPDQPAREPLLDRLAPLCASQGVPELLSEIAEAWGSLLAQDGWTPDALGAHASMRGRALVGVGAAILGGTASQAMHVAAEGAALRDLVRVAPDDTARACARIMAKERFTSAGYVVWPRAMRPVGMIVELSRGDCENHRPPREGSPGRIARMAWHALTGR